MASWLDLATTWVILGRGGRELNPLADGVIGAGGLPALVAYKFGLMLALVALCELLGGRADRFGRRVAAGLVAIWTLPPVWALVQISGLTV